MEVEYIGLKNKTQILKGKEVLMIKKGIIIFIILIMVGTGLYFILKDNNSQSQKFKTTTIIKQNIEKIISCSGTIEPESKVEVGTQVSGIIDTIFVDYNDRVEQGDMLAVLDTVELTLNVKEAKANLIQAKANFEKSSYDYQRKQKLYRKDLISKLEYIESKSSQRVDSSNYLSAKYRLEQAERNLEYAYVHSPIDGIVISRDVEEGQTVAASFQTPTLFVIAKNLSLMEIHAQVDESDIGMIKEGQDVRFTVAAYPDSVFYGKVNQVRLQSEVVQNVVMYNVIIKAENKNNLLLPGMTATIDFITEQKKDVLSVPIQALNFTPSPELIKKLMPKHKNKRAGGNMTPHQFSDDTSSQRPGPIQADNNRKTIWCMDDENNIKPIPVKVGVSDGINTEIIGNGDLQEGSQVITGLQEKSSQTEQNGRRGPGPPGLF